VGEQGAPSSSQFEKHFTTLELRQEMERQQQQQQQVDPPAAATTARTMQQRAVEAEEEEAVVATVELDPERKAWLASKQDQYDALSARLANGVPGPVRPALVR
jgi:hypothetical protein